MFIVSSVLGKILREACIAGGLTIERDGSTCTFTSASQHAKRTNIRTWYEVPDDLMKRAREVSGAPSIHADEVIEALVANVELNHELEQGRWSGSR